MKFINNIELLNDIIMYITKYSRKDIEEKIDELYKLTNNLNLAEVDNTRVSYIIDQRGIISDPEGMVIGNFYNHPILGLIKLDDGAFTGNSKYDFLTWLKENTHAYVAKQTDTGLRLKQLADEDRRHFVDGSDATSYITNTEGLYDVVIKFPVDIYYKTEPFCPPEETELNDDYVLVTLTSKLREGEKESDWCKFSQYKLIGVYQATDINQKLHSISGSRAVTLSQVTSVEYAKNRGTNFNICDYDTTRLIAYLFYGYYKSLGSQQICGYGTFNQVEADYYPKINGITDKFGMEDTTDSTGNGASTPNEQQIIEGIGSDIKSVNFWGLENCWGDTYEWISNLRIMKAYPTSSPAQKNPNMFIVDYLNDNASILITQKEGTTDRTYTSIEEFMDTYSDRNVFFMAIIHNNTIIRAIDLDVTLVNKLIKKMMFGIHNDLLPKDFPSSSVYDTYFTDNFNVGISAGSYVVRSGNSNDPRGGVSYLMGLITGNTYSSTASARLLYEGDKDTVCIIDDPAETL